MFITFMSAAVTAIDGGTPGHHLYLVSIALGLASKQGLTQFSLGIGMASWKNWSSRSREENHVEEVTYNTPFKSSTRLCIQGHQEGSKGSLGSAQSPDGGGGCRQVWTDRCLKFYREVEEDPQERCVSV